MQVLCSHVHLCITSLSHSSTEGKTFHDEGEHKRRHYQFHGYDFSSTLPRRMLPLSDGEQRVRSAVTLSWCRSEKKTEIHWTFDSPQGRLATLMWENTQPVCTEESDFFTSPALTADQNVFYHSGFLYGAAKSHRKTRFFKFLCHIFLWGFHNKAISLCNHSSLISLTQQQYSTAPWWTSITATTLIMRLWLTWICKTITALQFQQ